MMSGLFSQTDNKLSLNSKNIPSPYTIYAGNHRSVTGKSFQSIDWRCVWSWSFSGNILENPANALVSRNLLTCIIREKNLATLGSYNPGSPCLIFNTRSLRSVFKAEYSARRNDVRQSSATAVGCSCWLSLELSVSNCVITWAT